MNEFCTLKIKKNNSTDQFLMLINSAYRYMNHHQIKIVNIYNSNNCIE